MSIQLRSGNVWKNVSQIKLRSGGVWKNVAQAYLRTGNTWKSLFSGVVLPSIQTRVTVASSGGINAGSTIMNNVNVITLISTRYHWDDADVFTYIWQKSPDNVTWSEIGTNQSTTNPASGSSSSSITKVLSPSDFTSGPDMYFRFVFNATNSADSVSASSQSLPILISYYGVPTPAPGSPSITGSTVVGNTASANIGTWTNSPTSYDYRVYYTSGLSVYPLTYAGVKSISTKYLSGFSAALVTSAAHGYKVDDSVVISGMDSLFNGTHNINLRTSNTIYITLPTPTAYSTTSSYLSGSFVSYNGNAYRSLSTLPSGSNFSITAAYAVGNNIDFVGVRYTCLSALSASSAWTDAGTGYSVGDNVYYNSNRYRANSSLSSVSAYSGGTFYSVGQVVYAGDNRYQSKTSGNQGNSFTNTTYWTNLGSFAPGVNSMWTSVMPSNTSYWANVHINNSSYWTLQSFSDTATSGTTTAPNYYEGTVFSSTSISIPITTFDYRQGIDLRGATTSGSGAVLSFGVKAYNQATLSPSEYLGQAFIYGVPILSIGSITPSYTTASVPFTSSYISGYLLNLYTQPSITNVIGGATTVTYFAQNTFTSGQQVTITGVNPSVYNGVRTIQSANSTSFTVSANITDTYISGGTAKVTVSGYPLPVNSNTSPRSITGLSQGTTYYLEMTPFNNGMTGTMQTSSFTTLIQPTISNIAVTDTTLFPSSASSVSVSNTAPSNSGSVSWINGANTSFANLRSVTGSGSLSTQSDPTSLATTGTFTVISTGTANATIRAINNNKRVGVTWSQTNAQSYTIDYAIAGAGPAPLLNGNSSDSNPVVQLFSDSVARLVTVYNITVYPGLNQSGIGVTLSPPSNSNSATGANKTTDSTGSGSVTYTAPAVPPSGGSVSVSPTSGTAGTTQFTASPSGWSGTAPITFTYVWSYFNNSFQWVSVATGSTFTPSVISPSPLSWRVVVTAQNDAGTATATANFTVNNPPNTPTGLAATTTRTDGINVSWNPSSGATSYELWFGPVPTPSSIPDFLVGSATSYLDTSMTEGTNRTYYVRARNSAGASAWSSGVSGTRALPTPNVTQITALGLGNTSAPYIRFTFTSTNAASLSIMLYRSATSSTGPWTPLATRSVQDTTGTLVANFSSRTGTTSNWYYVDVIPYSGSGGTGTAGTTRTSRVKRGTETTTTTVYP
jgi:hypothetical protein